MFRPDAKPAKTEKKKPQPLKRTAIKKKFNPSGEGELFKVLIEFRPHVSFISGLPIDNISHNNCHHVLPKSQYSQFRLYEKNIQFVTDYEHHLIHFGTEDQRQEYSNRVFGCVWKRLDELKQELLNEYKAKII
jgi:hypothetical protein